MPVKRIPEYDAGFGMLNRQYPDGSWRTERVMYAAYALSDVQEAIVHGRKSLAREFITESIYHVQVGAEEMRCPKDLADALVTAMNGMLKAFDDKQFTKVNDMCNQAKEKVFDWWDEQRQVG